MEKWAVVALRRPTRCLAAVVALASFAACSAGGSTPIAHRLPVTAQPFALAEVARRVGLGRIVLANQAGVILTSGSGADAWVDPVAMEAVTEHVAAMLSAADPSGRPSYHSAAAAFVAELGALDIDYRSSLADCARHDIVTADRAFAPMALRYGFVDHTARDVGVDALVRTKGIPVVFTEPDVDSAPVLAVAAAAHTRIDVLDTLAVETPDEAARGATYLSLMTDNLAKLRSALACNTTT